MSTSQVPLHKRDLVTPRKSPLVAAGDLQFVMASAVAAAMHLVPPAQRPQFVGRFSDRLGRLWYAANLSDVRRIRLHLRQLFGDELTDDAIEETIRRQLGLTVWNYLILNLIPTLSHAQAETLLPVDGTEHLAAARQRGQPVLLLGAHVGPYAYPVAAVLLAKGYHVREIGHAQPRVGSSRLYQKLYWPRVSKTCEHLAVVNSLDGMSTAVLDILRSGQILYLLPDQFYLADYGSKAGAQLVSVPFLNHTVQLETGGLRLAKRLGAQILTALPRFEDGLYRVVIEPLPLSTTGFAPADLAQDLQRFMDLVAHCIVAQPFLWRDLRRSDLLARLGIAPEAMMSE
jgi:lauroyl/myristoyl acyltransferase